MPGVISWWKSPKLFLVIFIAVVAGGTLFFGGELVRLGRGEQITVRLGDGGATLSAPIFIAYHKLFFAGEQLYIHYSPFASGRDALKALVEGKVDIATVADTPIARAILKGEKFKIIATITQSSENAAVLAKEEISEPNGLIGKKIGFFPGTSSEYFLNEFLIKHQIDLNKITLVPLSPRDSLTSLRGIQVDAVSTFEPFISQTRAELGRDINAFLAPDIYTQSWNVVVSERLTKSPEILSRVLRALRKAETYCKTDSDDAIEIASNFLKISLESMKSMWPSLHINLHLSQPFIINIERQMSLQNSKDRSSKALPNVFEYIHFEAIADLYPDRVTIIR